jgi:hypothetical protein
MKVLDVESLMSEKRVLDDRTRSRARAAVIAGAAALIAAVAIGALAGDGFRRFAFSYLLSFTYFLTLALGALFFTLIQHVTRASWSVVVRRIAEITAATLQYLAIAAIPIVLMSGVLYGWAAAHDPIPALLAHKRAYLNAPFFVVRLAVYFALWSWLAATFFKRSRAQDESGDSETTVELRRLSAPALVIFALTVTFASFDLLMSLDYEWFSTIFGVYFFTGCALGFFAFLTVATQLLQRAGYLRRAVTIEHYHDLGKLIFAFTVFWAYIAFSQFMLIWYGDIPEETQWFIKRQTGEWLWFSVALLFVHFVLPFLWLLPRGFKRKKRLLFAGAVLILVAHYIDLYYLIMPEYAPGSGKLSLSFIDPLMFVAFAGLFLGALARIAGSRSLVPTGDPRLADSLKFENV